MGSLLAAEWLKLRKRWMPRVLLLILVVFIGLIFWGTGTSSDRVNLIVPRGWLAALIFGSTFAQFLWAILAGSWAGNEYGWGTIRMILSRRPNRAEYVLAAVGILLLSVMVAFILLIPVATVAGFVVSALTSHGAVESVGLPSNFVFVVVKCYLAACYVVSFYVVLSFAAGTIFRSSAVGIGVGIGITVAEKILTGIFFGLGGTWRHIAEHFPFSYAIALPAHIAYDAVPNSFFQPPNNSPSTLECIVALAIYIAVPLAATLILVGRRDITS